MWSGNIHWTWNRASDQITGVINPNKPNGFSHPYTFGESICHLRGVRCTFFNFCSICNWKSCKQTVTTLIRRRMMRRLTWVCTVCLCPTKGTSGLFQLISRNDWKRNKTSGNCDFRRAFLPSNRSCFPTLWLLYIVTKLLLVWYSSKDVNIFLISAQKHRLYVLVRTASSMRF